MDVIYQHSPLIVTMATVIYQREGNENIMLGWSMYIQIQQYKEIGLKRSQVARRLGINIKTVNRYWKVTPKEMVELQDMKRKSKYSEYEEVILEWLREYPDLSSSQIHDWLKERYSEYKGKPRTIRNLVRRLRKEHGIHKSFIPRQYQAMEDPPMGQQAQVDFGEKKVTNERGETMKLYGFAMVLSHSRYKYVEWTDRPITTAKAIEMHNHAFEYIGGIPKELVYDQDRVLVVSENAGDILYTAEFEKYRQTMGFHIHLCRASDPESKGRIEAVIKYAKNHFAHHRIYRGLTRFNQECRDWLERTANSSVHGTTEKVPAQVFSYEKDHLKPIPPLFGINPKDILTRVVRKDNTVKYLSNRYTVPLGTFQPGKEVSLQLKEENLQIIDSETGEIIAEHPVSPKRGQLIRNTNHLRDREQKIQEWKYNLLQRMPAGDIATTFLDEIHRGKPRYMRDHCQIISATMKEYEEDIVRKALTYCYEYELWSAIDLRDAAVHFHLQAQQTSASQIAVSISPPVSGKQELYQIKTEIRSIQDYVKVSGGK
jgi:transposase